MVDIRSLSIAAIVVFAMAKTIATKFLLVYVGGEEGVLHKGPSNYNIIIPNSPQCQFNHQNCYFLHHFH